MGKPVEDCSVHGHQSDTDRDVLRQVERHYEQDPHLEDVYPKGGRLRQDIVPLAYRRVEEIDEPAVCVFLVLVDHVHGQKRVEENQRQIVSGQKMGNEHSASTAKGRDIRAQP